MKIDIVLQATGQHSWNLARGWANAARQIGVYHRTFAPSARWDQPEPDNDDGLFQYLGQPQADAILLLGFDWHSQMLHTTRRWKARWQNAPIVKILYIHESIEDNCRLWEHDKMKQAVYSAAECADVIIYNDLADQKLLESLHPHAIWQPYGVDETVFACTKPYAQRIPEAVFRGKVTPFFTNKSYQQRREYIEFLQANNAMTLLDYDSGQEAYKVILQDYNNYRVALNFPSLGHNHPSRVPEVLGCGATLLTNRTGIPRNDALFEHGKHVWYYSNREELLEGVSYLSKHWEIAEKIAAAGHRHVLENLTLGKLLQQILGWCEERKHTFRKPTATGSADAADQKTIVVDGVMFQIQKGAPLGISRVWHCLLQELVASEHGARIVVLDRGNTAPRVEGIRYRPIRVFDFNAFEDEPCYLQDICDEENASMFFSTYYTWPEKTPSVLMIHDMIPEVRGMSLHELQWQAKARAIEKAMAYLVVSEATKRDFHLLYPQFADRKVYLTQNSAAAEYRPRTEAEIARFRKKYNITKPYFVLTGMRILYKNAVLFFRAFQLLQNRQDFEIICTGNHELETFFLPYVRGVKCHTLFLSDEDLSIAFAGAQALVYPSQYEGFGLPIVEAQQSGCPVITCRNSSIPEVSGDAVLYVGESDVGAMKDALLAIGQPKVREPLIAAGLENAKRFSWKRTGSTLCAAIKELDTLAAESGPTALDPINTPGRLCYYLNGDAQKHGALAAGIQYLDEVFRGKRTVDQRALGEYENAVIPQLGAILDEVLPRLAPLGECDSVLSYFIGVVSQERKLTREALQRFIHAVKGVNSYSAVYRRQLGLRMAGLSVQVGEYRHAKDILETLVLRSEPGNPQAALLLQKVERALKGGSPVVRFPAGGNPIGRLPVSSAKAPLKSVA